MGKQRNRLGQPPYADVDQLYRITKFDRDSAIYWLGCSKTYIKSGHYEMADVMLANALMNLKQKV